MMSNFANKFVDFIDFKLSKNIVYTEYRKGGEQIIQW